MSEFTSSVPDSWMETWSLPVYGEERLVGCCRRLRGPDLGEDSSTVSFLPFTMERREKIRELERSPARPCTRFHCIHFSSLPCPPPLISSFFSHWLPLSLRASLHHTLLSYQAPEVSKFIQTDRHECISFASGENTVVFPIVAYGLTGCWTLGDWRSLHTVAV